MPVTCPVAAAAAGEDDSAVPATSEQCLAALFGGKSSQQIVLNLERVVQLSASWMAGQQLLTKHFENISSCRRTKLQRLSLDTERGYSSEHTHGHLQPTKITVLISH